MTSNFKGGNAALAGYSVASHSSAVPLSNLKRPKATIGSGVSDFIPTFSSPKTGSSLLLFGHRVRMPTAARVLFVALISVLHLVSIVLLTLSLTLGSGGLVQSVALSLDWLALIVMALFLVHRVRFPQREYIRPRSMTAFYGLTFFSAMNLALSSVRLATGNKGLVSDFNKVGSAEAAAGTVVGLAAISTLLGMIGAYVSHTGCYTEPRRKVPKPLISWPVHDWHPFPTERPMASPISSYYGAPRNYIPGLIPTFRGEPGRPMKGISTERLISRRFRALADELDVPRGYQDMASMRKSLIASGGGQMAMNVYMAGPNGSTFELVQPPPPVPLLPPYALEKGGKSIQGNGQTAKGRELVPTRLQPPQPTAKHHSYHGRRASALANYF